MPEIPGKSPKDAARNMSSAKENIGVGSDFWEIVSVRTREKHPDPRRYTTRPISSTDITALSRLESFEALPSDSEALLVPFKDRWEIIFGKNFQTYSVPATPPAEEQERKAIKFSSDTHSNLNVTRHPEAVPEYIRVAMEADPQLRGVSYGDEYITYTPSTPTTNVSRPDLFSPIILRPSEDKVAYFPPDDKHYVPVCLNLGDAGTFLFNPIVFDPLFSDLSEKDADALPMRKLPRELTKVIYALYKEVESDGMGLAMGRH